jgi:hypothetical protein
MRWSYKTLHFELKKDGLLGSVFLDESEIEQSLNEYGQGGWELVSMLETRDGLIAVFKQALGALCEIQDEPVTVAKRLVPNLAEDDEPALVLTDRRAKAPTAAPSFSGTRKANTMFAVVEEEEREEPATSSADIGSIRIE